jgi:Zn-dependent metalloprotease
MTRTHSPAECYILPPVVLAELAEHADAEVRRAAVRSLAASATMRGQRAALTDLMRQLNLGPAQLRALTPESAKENRTVYDAEHGGSLPGVRRRGEGDPPSTDVAVNQAYDNAGITYGFYRDVFKRDSLDGHGMGLVSTVHYSSNYDNAFWQGTQMVYGDGSGRILATGSLTAELSVTAHEMTHGVVQHTANLEYHKQSGALNESMADVFGSMVKQYVAKQSADHADWLIGEGILGTALHGVALRSMKDPGTAFDHDQQPGHMDHYVDLPDDDDPRHDHGGVHINSGIPNKAFYLTATAIGGYSWETAGPIWYDALTTGLTSTSDFAAAAAATIASAAKLFGKGSTEEKAVRSAWSGVGL